MEDKIQVDINNINNDNKPKSNIDNIFGKNINVAKQENINTENALKDVYSNANTSAINSLLYDINRLRKNKKLPEINFNNWKSTPVYYISPNEIDKNPNAQKSFLNNIKDKYYSDLEKFLTLISQTSKGNNGFYDARYKYIATPLYPKNSTTRSYAANKGDLYTQVVNYLIENGYPNEFTKQHEKNHAIDHDNANIDVATQIFNVNDNNTPIGTNTPIPNSNEFYKLYTHGSRINEATTYASGFVKGLRNIFFKNHGRFPSPDELNAEAKTLLKYSNKDIMQYIINNKDSIKVMDPFLRYIELYKNGKLNEETKSKLIKILPFLVKNKMENINNMKYASLKTIKNKNDMKIKNDKNKDNKDNKNIINGRNNIIKRVLLGTGAGLLAVISSQALKRFLARRAISEGLKAKFGDIHNGTSEPDITTEYVSELIKDEIKNLRNGIPEKSETILEPIRKAKKLYKTIPPVSNTDSIFEIGNSDSPLEIGNSDSPFNL